MGNCLCLPYIAVAAIGALWIYRLATKGPVELQGHVDSRFRAVWMLFNDMIQSDREGAALAVLHKGELVVNLYGGFADRRANKPWTKDTMAVAFSITKIWAGLAAAILASRGLLQYDRKVRSITAVAISIFTCGAAWLALFSLPFVVTCRPGILTLPIGKWEVSCKAAPLWTPGTSRGYHALTYGFLVDEMIKRLHPMRFSVSQIYEEEVWGEGVQFHIGSQHLCKVPVAVISNPPRWLSIFTHLRNPLRIIYSIWCHFKYHGIDMLSANYPYFLGIMRTDIVPYNNPAVRELPLISCMGIGTAEGFAKAINQVFKRKLISESVWNRLDYPTATEEDIVMSSMRSFGHGFTYIPHPVRRGDWLIRFIGNGLQVVEVDRKSEIITVMMRNGLRAGDSGEAEYEVISRTILQIAEGLQADQF